jgi:hypothetical protein
MVDTARMWFLPNKGNAAFKYVGGTRAGKVPFNMAFANGEASKHIENPSLPEAFSANTSSGSDDLAVMVENLERARGNRVRDKFCRQVSLHDTLIDCGYIQTGNHRYKSDPEGTDGSTVIYSKQVHVDGEDVTIEYGFTYSDRDKKKGFGQPCGQANKFDAFDLLAFYKHSGDEKTATDYAKRLFDEKAVQEVSATGAHMLTNFRDYGLAEPDIDYVIEDFIQEGVVVIAGSAGIGKTNSLLPLAAASAHLCPDDYELKPPTRRKVVFATEDPGQVQRIILSLIRYGGWKPLSDWQEWFKVVQASPMKVKELIQPAQWLRDNLSTTNHGPLGEYEALPLIVFDTRNAVIHLEQDNDNTEVASTLAHLNSGFEGFPIWVITHVAKSLKGRTEVKELSIRGAGAWEDNAIQTLYLVEENDQRWLVRGKSRFETSRYEMTFDITRNTEVRTTKSCVRNITLMHSIGRFPEADERKKVKEKLIEARDEHDFAAIKSTLAGLQGKGVPISKSQLVDAVGGYKTKTIKQVASLIELGELEEYVPDVKPNKNFRTGVRLTSNPFETV